MPFQISLPKNSFFGYWVKEGQIKQQKYFLNCYLVGVKTEQMKNLLFTGSGIEEWLIPPTNIISPVTPMLTTPRIVRK